VVSCFQYENWLSAMSPLPYCQLLSAVPAGMDPDGSQGHAASWLGETLADVFACDADARAVTVAAISPVATKRNKSLRM